MAVPALSDLLAHAPDADPEIAAQHRARLDDRYFSRFTTAEVATHLDILSRLSAERPRRRLRDRARWRRGVLHRGEF